MYFVGGGEEKIKIIAINNFSQYSFFFTQQKSFPSPTIFED